MSKKKAAENMLEELRKLPPLSPPEMVVPLKIKKKQPLVKKKTRNLIKVAQVIIFLLLSPQAPHNFDFRSLKASRRVWRS
jgi:hypothetical protein